MAREVRKFSWYLRTTGIVAAVCMVALSASFSTAQLRQVTTGFQSDASRYVWTAAFDLDHRVGPWRLFFANRFRSEAFLLNSRISELRDENVTLGRFSRQLSPVLAAIAFGEGNWFSHNAASTVEGYGGVRFSPRPFILFEPAVGLVIDRKPGLLLEGQTEPVVIRDTGPGLSITGRVTEQDIGGFKFGASTTNRWHFISPRFGRTSATEASARKDFERGLLTVDIRYANLVRQSYQASSFLNRFEDATRTNDTIEATTSDTVDSGLRFEYPVSKTWNLVADARFSVNKRNVRTLRAPPGELFFDTNFDRQVADIRVMVRHESPRATVRLTAARGVAIERRGLDNADALPPGQAAQKSMVLRQADFDRGIFWIRGEIRKALSRSLSVRAVYRSSILRHDTPVVNLDDRDESLVDAELGATVSIRHNLQADMRLFGVQHHTVFIDASRSGENNKRRSLRFVPSMRWQPNESTDVELRTEVRAVYTTDDFSFPGQPRNDQSAREMKYRGSIRHQLAAGSVLTFDASHSRLLLGRFLREDFAEIPFDTVTTTSGWVRFEVGHRWRAEVGVRAFLRTDFERSLTVRYQPGDADDGLLDVITRPGRERLLQIGPTGAFSMPMTSGSEIRMTGWVQFQEVRLTLYGDLPPDDEEIIREAARNAERRAIPNLMISVLWNL